jgi:hypothetical protein
MHEAIDVSYCLVPRQPFICRKATAARRHSACGTRLRLPLPCQVRNLVISGGRFKKKIQVQKVALSTVLHEINRQTDRQVRGADSSHVTIKLHTAHDSGRASKVHIVFRSTVSNRRVLARRQGKGVARGIALHTADTHNCSAMEHTAADRSVRISH